MIRIKFYNEKANIMRKLKGKIFKYDDDNEEILYYIVLHNGAVGRFHEHFVIWNDGLIESIPSDTIGNCDDEEL